MNLLGGRIARNVYFWLVFFLNFYSTGMAHEFPYSSAEYAAMVITSACIYGSLLYINNLWLLPRFLSKKLYGAYFLRLGSLILVYAFIFTYYNYWFDKHFPLADFSQVALISLGSADLYKDFSHDSFIFLELMAWLTLPLALFIFIFSMSWFMNDYFVQQKRLDIAIKEKLESELALIKHQVSPHFLFNTLNNLYGLSLVKSDILPTSILQLSHILRYLIYDSGTSLISIEKEKEVIESYINIELLRLSNTKHFSYTIKTDKNYLIPPLLWLPVLENVFKHGTRQISDETFVSFDFTIENDCLQIHSKNSLNSSTTKNHEHSGFGIKALKKRLDIIYPGKYSLHETKDQQSYEIILKVNLNG